MSEMNLYQALLAAQQAMGPVLKTSTNPAFKSKYADLGSVIDAIMPAFHDHGLVVVQRFTMDAGGPILNTDLIHAASGDRITSSIAIACKDPLDPQKVGSAVTYLRRYSLLALAGVAPEDDDGNTASNRPVPTSRDSALQTRHDAPRATTATSAVPTPLADETVEARILEGYQWLDAGKAVNRILDHIEEGWDDMTAEQQQRVKDASEAIKNTARKRKAAGPPPPAIVVERVTAGV